MFTIVVQSDANINHHPSTHWKTKIKVDGREIRACFMKNGMAKVKTSRMVSMEDGKLVEGKLIFARLVCSTSLNPRNLICGLTAIFSPQRTTDDDANVTLQTTQLQSVGQIVISFERGAKGRDLEVPNRPCVVQSDVGIASERGKK
jgi:hypothetical protein